MKNPIEESYNFLISKWGSIEYKGRGVIHCVKPMDYTEIVCRIITQMRNKNPTIKVYIAVGKWEQRVKLFGKFKEKDIDLNHISCVTEGYVNPRQTFKYDVGFIIGVHEWNSACTSMSWRCKFLMMMLIEDIIKADKLAEIYKYLPAINTSLSSEQINNYRLSLPVEEERIPITFDTAQEIETYNKYSEYITQVLQIFGDFNNITYARKGTPDGKSADQYLYEVAVYNGWSNEMDMTNPFSAQIDACYNPIILGEKASTCYNIMRQRRNLVTDANAKLKVIGDILEDAWADNPDKTFMIISDRGEFASAITNYLNERFGLVCGDYHDKIEPRPLVDENGVPVVVKSGVNKGELVIAKSQRISGLNLAAFNAGRLRVLSLKNSSNSAISASVGAFIITSPLCSTIDEIRYRFNHVDIDNNKVRVYKLYMNGTIEEKALEKEKLSPNHIVINDEKKVILTDENNIENIC